MLTALAQEISLGISCTLYRSTNDWLQPETGSQSPPFAREPTCLACTDKSRSDTIHRMETPRRIIIRTAWCLAKSYWKSAEKSSAWSLLVAVIVLNLVNVYIGVRINEWNRAFYNALQTFNAMALFRQVGIFGILVAFAVLA